MTDKKKFPKFVSPKGIAEFVYVHAPDSEGQFADDKYKITVRWPKGTDLSKLDECIEKAVELEWGDKRPRNLMLPLRDGDEYYDDAETDEQREKRERFRGHVFITAKTKFKPGVVDRDGVALAAEEGECADCRVDPIYAGDTVRFSAIVRAFKSGKNKGVNLQLRNVKRIEKGERTVGDANADFGDEDDDDFGDGGATPDDI